MQLLIDAGNTRIKWALVDGDEWLRNGALPVEQAGELPQQFAGMRDIRQIWASNVAGEEVAQHIRKIKADRVNFIAAREMQCGVHNGYSNAGQLGSDRWAALIAAWHLVRAKCMVVNCGTAITVDSLSGQGRFLGGLIVPGVELMQRSLVGATRKLKPEQGRYAEFPLNTADAMFSGAIQACCGAIERQYALLDDDSAPVLLSGGAAGILEKSLNVPLRVVDNLVLQGLLLIAQESVA
jgi:type III pantothenate kinase